MGDEKRRKNSSGNDHRSGGNIWLVLAAVTAAILFSAFLFGNRPHDLSYPNLITLLQVEAEATRLEAADRDHDELTASAPGAVAAPSVAGTDAVDSASGETANADAETAPPDESLDEQTGDATDRGQDSDSTAIAESGDDQVDANEAVANRDGDAASPQIEIHRRAPSIVVPLFDNPETLVEYSRPQKIKLADEMITGQVMYRVVRRDGAQVKEKPRLIDFQTVRSIRNEAEDEALLAALDASGVSWNTARPSRFFAEQWPVLLMIGVLVLMGIMMMRRLGGVGSPMSFSRSRGKLYGEEDLPISFDDAAGIDEAVEEVREVVDFLRNSDKYQALGGRIPKGVLLVGPPGTGKTLLARAIAGEAGVPFFSLSGSDFVEMFVGVGAARVRDMFQQAVSRAPCIIFIDELDALGKSRSGSVVGGHDEREQTLNALLVEMDGFDANAGVIVIAATNRPETLDPALLRPGRFDRHVLVDRPDVAGREQILKVHVKSVKLDEQVDLRHVASITSGFVGADLANLVNEAALLAARSDRKSVGMQEFNEAVERITAGLEKKKRVMNQDEKIRVAYHESGHAIVAAALPNTDPVHKVSIIPRGMAALGYMMQRPESERFLMTKSELESQMKVMLAGTLAEEMIFQDISTGAQNDLERCTEVARGMVMDYGMSRLGRLNFRRSTRSPFLSGGGGDSYQSTHSEEMAKMIDKEVSRIVDDALTQTREILTQRRETLEAVTQRLLEVESIDSDELMRLIEQHSNGPWLVPGTVTEKPRATINTVPEGSIEGKTRSE